MPFELPAETQELSSLNLGSQGALESAAPDATDAALPAPPSNYKPGYTAPVRQAQQDSLLYRIGEVLSAGGTQPGDIPAPIKLRMAQQEADLHASQNKLAWDNFYAHNRLAQETIKEHNRSAMASGMQMLPQFKGIINSITDPEERTAMATHLGKMLDSFAPGLGKVAHTMDKDPAKILGYDMIMQHPVYGPQYQKLAATMSYEKQMEDPGIQQLVEMMGRDTIPTITSRFTVDQQKKLASGKMSQPEFTDAYNTAITDVSFGPVKPTNIAFAKAVLNTPYGEEIMAGMGVKLNKAAVKLEAMRPAGLGGNPMNAAKFAELQRVDAEIALEQDHPTATSDHKLKMLNDRRDVLLRVQSPQGSPGESKSNTFSHALVKRSGGKMQTASDLQDMTPGTPEYAQGLKWINEANEEAKAAGPTASMAAKMGAPAQVQSADVFSRKALLQDNPSLKMVGPQSEESLRTNPDNVHLEKDEQTKFKNLMTSKQAGKSLFDMAEKVFTAKSAPELLKQQSTYAMFGSQLTAGAGGLINPEMKVYSDVLNAWAGNNAKALGGEVGVLTNVDIDRWVRTFPSGSDTPTTIKAKRKIFNEMVSLVQRVAVDVLAGNSSAASDPKVRQKIEGLIGSAEGLTKPQTEGTTSQTGKLSPRQKLEQQMRAE